VEAPTGARDLLGNRAVPVRADPFAAGRRSTKPHVTGATGTGPDQANRAAERYGSEG